MSVLSPWPQKLRQLWASPVVRGFSFMSLMRYGTKAFSLLRWVIIARWLGESAPYQLGTFGIVLLVIAVTEVFTQTGINIILIRDQKTLLKYLDTAWVISLVRGFLIALGIWLITPWLVHFYNNPDLEYFLRWALLIPIFRGFINPAIIRYQQDLQFGRESLLRTLLQLVDAVSGLLFALILGNAFGLLLGVILGVVAEVTVSFWLFRPRPSLLGFRWGLLQPLFSETKFVIVNGMVTYMNENLDDILIARLLGTSGLGFYQLAYKLSSSVTIEIGNTLRDTLYPVYAKLSHSPKTLTPLVEQVQWRQLMWYALLIGPSFVLARPVIHLVLREDWLVIVPAFQLLLISGSLRGLINAWFPLFVLSDTVKWNFLLNSVSTFIMVVGLFALTPHFGLMGAALAIVMSVALVIPFVWQAKNLAMEKLRATV